MDRESIFTNEMGAEGGCPPAPWLWGEEAAHESSGRMCMGLALPGGSWARVRSFINVLIAGQMTVSEVRGYPGERGVSVKVRDVGASRVLGIISLSLWGAVHGGSPWENSLRVIFSTCNLYFNIKFKK